MCRPFSINILYLFDSFVSTLVTAVLTHHLAWVPTVMPAGGSPSRTYLDKHSAKWVSIQTYKLTCLLYMTHTCI